MARVSIVVVDRKRFDLPLEADANSIVFRKRVTYPDFAAAATTGNLDLSGFPGGLVLERCYMSLITAFSGGAVSACTLSAGTTSSAATYLGATNVFTGATAGGAVTVAAGAGLGSFLGANATPTAKGTIRIQCLTTSANTNVLTAGKADLYFVLRAFSVRTS